MESEINDSKRNYLKEIIYKINSIGMFRIDKYEAQELYSNTVDDAVVMTFTITLTNHTTIIL